MEIKPCGDKILLEPVLEETKSGIVLPDTVEKQKPKQGKVLAVGPGKLLESGERSKVEIKVGDIVAFMSYMPGQLKVEDKEYLIISAEEIMAVLSK